MYRDHTKVVKIGNRVIGGGNPILIQSMTNTPTEDVAATVAQIHRLEEVGCEIIRCTVPTLEAAKAISEIRKQISIPLVADIHFDYKMAIAAMENGADKIRINPGNIGGADRVAEVVRVARERNIPIRVGVNSGSLEKDLVEKYHGVTAEGIVESALDKVHMIEDLGYDNLVISIKSSDVMMCVHAHELLAGKTPYPLHVGITESGTVLSGNIKSAIGLGLILNQGIGDTIRVSLTGDVVAETPEKELVMIRQFRHGSGRIELEVPGGCIDRRDSDPLEAAERELLEETGFAGENPHIIGKVCPNPAIQHNTCYVVKIDNVRRVSEPQLEDTEDIEHLVVPQSKVREFLRSGAISHGIVLNALFFYLMDQCC